MSHVDRGLEVGWSDHGESVGWRCSVGQSRGKYVFVRNTSLKKSHLYTFDAIAGPHHMTLRLGHALSSLFHAGSGLSIHCYNPTELCKVVKLGSVGSWRSWLFSGGMGDLALMVANKH